MEVDLQNSDSDTNDSSDENDLHEQALTEKARQLENNIADNKYLYDAHVELVGLYKTLGDLTSLREAYQRFHTFFPLTSTLWLNWINTEKTLATTEEQKQFVFQLFDMAVEDYLSIELWSEYAQYTIGAFGLDKTRDVLERGLNTAGLVVSNGSLLWATYREIENSHISLHQEGSEEWKKQILKLANIFKRELSIPLLGMETTYEEWKQWYKTLPDGIVDSKTVEYGYNKARKILETYKPFEDELLTSDSIEALFDTYKKYIKIVGDPSTIICIFERAAVQLCLVSEFWIEYCSYVFKLGDQALSVCKKALRNCPWSEQLWIIKLRVLENLQKDECTVMQCFEEAISSIFPSPGLELWLAYLEYTHRCVGSPEKLDKLFDQAIQQLGFDSDPHSKVGRFFARILFHRGDAKRARKIWGHILAQNANKGLSSLWLEYANLERQYGEPHTVRAVFQKALNAVKDFPQYIMDEWLMYERHFGSLPDVMKCIERCREISEPLNQASEYQNKEDSQQFTKNDNLERVSNDRKRKMDRKYDKHISTKRVKEQKHDSAVQPENKIPNDPINKPSIDKNPKTTVFISNLLPNVDEKTLEKVFPNAVRLEVATDRKGKSRCFGYVQFKTEEEVMVALARDREPLDGRPIFISEIKTERTEKKSFKYATNEEKNKLFVRGLPVTKTKEEVFDIFSKYGAKDVRLVLHKSGQPRGLAYVEFETEKQALEAMKQTDQMSINDHVISVAISAPPAKKEKQLQRGIFENTFNKKDAEPTRHARSRLQTSLLPRSLQVKSAETKKDEDKKNNKGENTMKSNSDFRALLLNK